MTPPPQFQYIRLSVITAGKLQSACLVFTNYWHTGEGNLRYWWPGSLRHLSVYSSTIHWQLSWEAQPSPARSWPLSKLTRCNAKKDINNILPLVALPLNWFGNAVAQHQHNLQKLFQVPTEGSLTRFWQCNEQLQHISVHLQGAQLHATGA